MSVTILLLAAGGSTRMGGADKLAREIDGEPLLHRAVREAVQSGADVIVVTTPQRMPIVADLPVTTIVGGADMSASLAAGLLGIDADAVIIALADMPDVTAAHYTALIHTYSPDTPICRAATADGTPGHPVLFDRRYFDELRAISGDQGAKDILKRHADQVVLVPTTGEGARIDLDTEADWGKYRK